MFSERSYPESLLKSTTAVLSDIINFGVSMIITCFREIGKLKLKIGERECSQFLVVKIGPFLERGISFWANSRTGYKKIGPFLERGISFRAFFFRTGCQFGAPGGTYPLKKYPSAPPPPGNSHLIELLCFKLFSNGSTRG